MSLPPERAWLPSCTKRLTGEGGAGCAEGHKDKFLQSGLAWSAAFYPNRVPISLSTLRDDCPSRLYRLSGSVNCYASSTVHTANLSTSSGLWAAIADISHRE